MDFTIITLNAAAKAMSDTVLPTLSAAGNGPALEQAHLVRDAIEYARDRVDLIGERRRTEAIDQTDLIAQLLALGALGDDTAVALAEARTTALRSLADPATSAEQTAAIISVLGERITALLAEIDSAAPESRAQVERAVLDHALRRLELDRAWLLPLGFDPEPSSVRDLRGLLAQTRLG